MIAAMAVLVASGSARAQPEEVVSLEGRCFAMGAILSQNADPKNQQTGQMIMNFFMGRISGLGKPVDLDKALPAMREETQGGVGPLRDKCAAIQKAASALLITQPAPAAAPR